jgi:tRNA (adenine57-N1/adenine58-N1)-methyltransferase
MSVQEKVERMKMGARPIYPYDSGIMCAMLDVKPGSRVLEAGTGSGGFTTYLGEMGAKVISYERNKDFYTIAKNNLKAYKTVRVRLGDVSRVKEKNFDAIFFDLQNPDAMIKKLNSRLKKGGHIGIYSPIMDDIKPIWRELEKNFINIRAVLLDHREIQVKKYARIKGMLGFPGFFIWAQKARK